MKRNIHWWIYGWGLGLSILFIGLSFISKKSPAWQNVFCGIGASGVGAVFLSFALEWQNESRKIKDNKTIFQAFSIDIYRSLCYLLIVINRLIDDFYREIDVESFSFENINIKSLIEKYCDAINRIKEEATPILCTEELISEEMMTKMRIQSRVKKWLTSCNQDIDKYREEFNSLKDKFETSKSILLANGICDKNKVFRLNQVLHILSTQGCLTHQESLIEMGRSLKELIDCELISVLEDIGFNFITFSNMRGYLETAMVEK